ncbi:hypothetical protein B0H13DRAFT_1870009 [Mycena leptocephala]|nr:hypothetical protein B0H13DRAFT_1870009 [Mycena leptocephala]
MSEPFSSAAVAAGITFNGLSCPDTDESGSNWTNSIVNIQDNTQTCDYSSGASCAYFTDGSANTADSTDRKHLCPDTLDGVSSHSTTPTPSPPQSSPPPTTSTDSSTSETSSVGPTKSQIRTSSVGSSSSSRSTISTAPSFPTSGTEASTAQIHSTSDNPSSTSSPSPQPKLHDHGIRKQSCRIRARNAAIAGSIVSLSALGGSVLLVIWIRRRRTHHRRQPEQYINSEHTPQGPSIMQQKGDTPVTDIFSPLNQVLIEPQNELLPHARIEEESPRDETVAQRLRRVEAQLETLLSMGLHESAPPSYRGE